MKLIPRLKPYFNLKEFIAASTPTSGNIERFEKVFAQKFGCSYGIMFPYGRSGLYSLFKIWNLKDSEVVIPAYTCVVVPHAVVLSGNIPVFVDCAEGSFNMALESIRNAITEKTRVVIPTHLFGYAMDVTAVNAIVKGAEEKYGHKIYIIQDCAHSFGCKWNRELVTKQGDAALFGLNISKIISSIFGGMIITNNKQIFNELRSFRDKTFKKKGFEKTVKRFLYLLTTYFIFNPYIYYWVNKLERLGMIDKFVKYNDESKIEFPGNWNEMPTEIEARVGLANLKKYDEIIERRIDSAQKYFEFFKENSEIQLPPNDKWATFSHFVALVENRDQWIKIYLKKKIQLGWIIDYTIPEMPSYGCHPAESFSVAGRYAKTIINFPVWGGKEVAKKVINKLISVENNPD